MGAYGNMEPAIAGLKLGLGGTVESWRAAAVIPFGGAVFGYKGDAVNAYGYKKDTSKVVYSADFIASNSTIVTVNGVATAAVVYGTSHAATIAALVNAIKALAGVEAVLDTTDTNSRTILIRTKGVTSVVTSATTAGSSQPTTTITTASGQVLLGFALFTQKESVGIAAYAIGDEVNVLKEGASVYTLTGSAVSVNSPALIDAAGLVANAGASLGEARIKSTVATAGLALVEPEGQYDLTYAGSF